MALRSVAGGKGLGISQAGSSWGQHRPGHPSARMNMLYLSKQSVGAAGERERRTRYDNNV